MEAVHHFGFLGIEIFNCRYGCQSKYVLQCHISHQSVKPLPRYGRSSIFQDGGGPPSWIFKSSKF